MTITAADPRAVAAAADPLPHAELVERTLADADVLNASQKRNARLKIDDLREGRLVWESVPFRLLVEFNRRCNVQCVHCDIERAGTGDLPMDAFERLMDRVGWGVWEVMPVVGGEPTLAPVDAIAPIVRRHNVWLNFITNGIRFTRAFFEPVADVTARVQFSFHSHRRELAERIMPHIDFDGVVRNIRDTVAIAEQTGAHVVPCIVPMYDMLDHMEDYVRFVADLGVKRLIIQKTYPQTPGLTTLDPSLGRDPAAEAETWARTLLLAKSLGIFIETDIEPLFGDPDNVPAAGSRFDILQDNVHIVELFRPGFCCSTAVQSVIEWDGTVRPCIRDPIHLGNLHEDGFLACWNGPRMARLRESFVKRQPCRTCAICSDFYLGHP